MTWWTGCGRCATCFPCSRCRTPSRSACARRTTRRIYFLLNHQTYAGAHHLLQAHARFPHRQHLHRQLRPPAARRAGARRAGRQSLVLGPKRFQTHHRRGRPLAANVSARSAARRARRCVGTMAGNGLVAAREGPTPRRPSDRSVGPRSGGETRPRETSRRNRSLQSLESLIDPTLDRARPTHRSAQQHALRARWTAVSG